VRDRIAYIDLAKGICISIVMLFHIKESLHRQYLIDPILFTCCMLPPFFFLAGAFLKEETTFRRFLIKKVNRLLLPFAFFYLTTAVLLPNALHHLFGTDFATVLGWPSLWAFIYPCAYPNIPLWFLWCLFVMAILFRAMLHFSRKCFPRHAPAATAAMTVLCAAIGTYAGYRLPTDIAHLVSALSNMPFLGLGYLAAQTGLMRRLTHLAAPRRLCLAALALAVMLLSYIPLLQYTAVADTITCYLCKTAGILFIITLASLARHIPLLSYLGSNTIIVLLTHGLLLRAAAPLIRRLALATQPDIALFAVWTAMALAYYLITPLCKRYLPHVTGQKPLLSLS